MARDSAREQKVQKRQRTRIKIGHRLEQIEAALPDPPRSPETGRPTEYHSRQYRLIAELIGICKELMR